MTGGEEMAATYACLIGRYGEDSPQAKDFAAEHDSEQDYPLLIGVVLLCRQLSEGSTK